MITYEELVKEYREWLVKKCNSKWGEGYAEYLERNNIEPKMENGETESESEDGTLKERFEECLNQFDTKSGFQEEFVYFVYSKPIFDESGDVESYTVLGYEIF